MKYKSIIILILAVFVLISVAGVSASDANDTAISSEDTQYNLEINDNNQVIEQTDNDENLSVENDLDVLSTDYSTYSELSGEIGDELVGSETIADYVVGETYTLNIVDSTIRPVTENTVIGNNNENAVYTVVFGVASDFTYGEDVVVWVLSYYNENCTVAVNKEWVVPLPGPGGGVGGLAGYQTVLVPVDTKNVCLAAYEPAVVNFGVLDVGTYVITAGNNAKSVTVSKADVTIDVVADDVTYGEDVIIEVTGSVNGDYTVTVNGVEKDVALVAGEAATVNFGVLDATTYAILTYYAGTGNYNAAVNDTESVTVSKADVTIDVVAADVTYGENVTVEVTGSVDGDYTVTVNGVTKDVSLVVGEAASVNFGTLAEGSYNITASYAETTNYNAAVNDTVVVVVQKALPAAETTLSSEYTSVPSVYAGVVNNLTLTVKNTGKADASDVVVSVYLGDELVGSETIADYVVGETYTLNIVDSTIRPVTENTVIGNNNENAVYTVVVSDADGEISNDDFSFVVLYNGNLGKDYAYPGANPTLREYTFVGDVIVVNGNTYSAAAKTNRTDVLAVDLGDGSVEEALLYVSYNWDKAADGDFNSWNTTFNGQVIVPIASYRDQGNLGKYGNCAYGLVVYNVTGLVVDGDNAFALNKTSGMVAVYPTSLIVLVDNPNSAAVNTVYIVEEADLLSKSYNKDLDASYSTVFSTVDGDATLYVFAAGAQAGEGDLVINGNTVSNVWSGTSSSFDTYMTDVDAGDIAVDFVSTGSTILALHQMVVVQNIRKSTTLDANDLVMTYDDGSSWNVTLTDGEGNAIEGVVVKISTPNEIYNLVTDANGTVSLPINLDSGSYEFNASFDGNNDYISSSVNAVITVNKVDSTLNVDGFEFTYGGVGSTVVSFTGATGVVAEIVNQSSAVVSVDGETITVSGLTPGSYDLAVTTIPDDNHNAVTETVAVTVNKADPLLTISYDADANEVVATLTNANGKALVTANVIVSLNGENQTLKTNSKGQVKVSTENLTQGSYVASVSYKGNSKFNPSNASMVINVRLASCVSLVYDDANELVGTLTNGEGKALVTANVIVNLNGVDYALKTNSKGQVKVSAENLTYGIYPASISYKGNAKYNPSSASIVVNTKLNPCITLDYNDDAKELVVTLTNAEGKALVTANVIVNIDGVDYALKTNSKGKAKLSTADFAPRNYTASVTYKGNSKYNPASATEEIAVQ